MSSYFYFQEVSVSQPLSSYFNLNQVIDKQGIILYDLTMKTEYLKLNEIVERYKISKPTIYRLIKDYDFPKGEWMSPQVRLWKMEDIEQWKTGKNKEDRKDLLTE